MSKWISNIFGNFEIQMGPKIIFTNIQSIVALGYVSNKCEFILMVSFQYSNSIILEIRIVYLKVNLKILSKKQIVLKIHI